ncbi:hypothetical protein KPH14_002206 [Odynerus spinipes]|uniref:NADH:ubiquinone oxidoreductase intermediate-associated protein 30 domain-containing protein n=1 Tax=Odynerus spinipes TaxID=1348599 RepID=A0AAD9RL13_9HYME|nr:hypothetical protein KPH14_002206 [Odynerus spinipes]
MNVLTHAIKFNKPVIINTFYQSHRLVHAHQQDERSNYPKVYHRKPSEEKLSLLQRAKKGYFQLKEEFKLYMKETKDRITPTNQKSFAEHNEIKVIWRFDGSPNCLDPWLTVCDSDYNEGYSTCKLDFTPEGKAIFSGNLDYRVPKDGKIQHAGYAALRTVRFRKSFKREARLNWEIYNHLVMRVRGDGVDRIGNT